MFPWCTGFGLLVVCLLAHREQFPTVNQLPVVVTYRFLERSDVRAIKMFPVSVFTTPDRRESKILSPHAAS